MRILIVDYGTEELEALVAMCSRHQTDVLPADGLTAEAVQDYEAVILAGDYTEAGVWQQPPFTTGAAWLKAADKPVLGICQGFAALCYAFGEQLHESADLTAAAGRMVPTDDGAKLFQGSDPIKVAESVRWNVDELPKELLVLARSETGIEAVRHKIRPIYGLQLRPGDFIYPSDGKLVFENLLDAMAKHAGKARRASGAA